jgi:hypothetical protein
LNYYNLDVENYGLIMKILTQLPFIYNKLTMEMGGGFGGGKSIPTFTKYAWFMSLKCNENLVMK